MRTHPPPSSKLSRRACAFRAPFQAQVCAEYTSPVFVRRLRASARFSCVIVRHQRGIIMRAPLQRIVRRSRHRAPSRATAPPCFFFFSVAHCARDELAQSAPFQVSCTIACYGAPLLLLQRRLRAHGLRSLCRSRHHAPLCATAPPASSSSASPIAAQAKFIYLRADGQPSIIFAPTGDYQYLSRRRAQ